MLNIQRRLYSELTPHTVISATKYMADSWAYINGKSDFVDFAEDPFGASLSTVHLLAPFCAHSLMYSVLDRLVFVVASPADHLSGQFSLRVEHARRRRRYAPWRVWLSIESAEERDDL